MKLPRRNFLHLAAGAAALLTLSRIARAQAYPARPVRMIVPFGPGGNADIFGRIIAQKLSEQIGNQFYVENIIGAGGNIGVGRAALAAPDGYTMLVTPPSYVINPALYDKIPYDARKSFDPVTLAVSTTVVLAVHPSVPAQTVKDLVALIKTNPSKYNYATAGVGSPGHLVGEMYVSRSTSTLCIYRTTARAWRSARRSQAIRRFALPRRRQLCRRPRTASCAR
jgi:tripartite-type tricarboxylate transporter receptor subunit TctC